jgi:hypothetical protein
LISVSLIVNKKGIKRLMRRGDCKASHGAILRPSQRPLWSIASLSPRSQIDALGRRYHASSTWAGFAYLAPNAFEQVNQGKSEQSRVASTAERAPNFLRLTVRETTGTPSPTPLATLAPRHKVPS